MAAPDRPNPARTLALPGTGTLIEPSLVSRLVGLGSIFGKGVRDSRRAALIIGGLLGLLVLVSGSQVAIEYDTALERAALAAQMSALPAVFQGMLGEPIGIETIGGFLSWRVFGFIPVMVGIWSIVALSGALAGELARGSLDVVVTGPIGRSRVAIEKLAAHMAALAIAVAILGALAYITISAFGTLPNDPVGLDAILGQSVWVFVATLAPGAAAFAVAPFVGRASAVGVGALVLFLSFLVNGYGDLVPVFDAVRGLSYFDLTSGHRPMAGAWDWPAMGLLTAIVAAVLAGGVVAFARRDMLVPSCGRQIVPQLDAWIMGPFTRSVGERLPAALVWGAALGLYGVVLATSADEFVAVLADIPQMVEMVERLFPGADILSVGGFLQLAFFSEAIILVGLGTAFLVSGWASDESERRIEMILGAPVSRIGWALKSGLGVMVAIAVMTLLTVLGVVAGAWIQGEDGSDIALGVSVLGAYGMAVAGVGLAVGGLIRPGLAAITVVALSLGFYLLDLLGTILRFPDAIMQLSLNQHLGKPILGEFDGVGLAICAVMAIGGLGLAAFGMGRRDIGR